MRAIAVIDDPRLVQKILRHLGALHDPPARGSPPALRDPTPTNRVTTWIRGPTAKTCSPTETHPHTARPEYRSAPAHRRFWPGRGSGCACSRPIYARTAYPSCQNAVPQGQDRPRKRQKLPVDIPAPPCQYRAMLGEPKNQLSLTRAALSTCGRAKKQIPTSPNEASSKATFACCGPDRLRYVQYGSFHVQGRCLLRNRPEKL